MAAQRFRPAALLRDPRQFGRVETLTAWTPVQVFRPEVVAAALLQHMSAFEVRRELSLIPDHPPARRTTPPRTPVRSLDALADAMGETLRTLEQKLNGQATASLQDLAGWAYHLDQPEVWPGIGTREMLKRPSDRWVLSKGPRISSRLPVRPDDQGVMPDK
jgi:hypothetical protein